MKKKKEQKSKKNKKNEEKNILPEEDNSYINPFKISNKENNLEEKNNYSFHPKNKKTSDNILFNKSQKSENLEDISIKKNANNSNLKQSGKLLFNPKISKNKTFEPLFSKYEQLEGQSPPKNIKNNIIKEPVFKKSQEIFPSQLGFEMPYKSKLKQSYKSTTYNNYRNSIKKELSKDKNRGDNNKNNNEKNEQKTYYSYKSSIKSDNPFKGQSKYEKSNKQRKNEIAKTVEKEENEFYDIAVIEEKISNKSQLNEEEINQLINRFSNIM